MRVKQIGMALIGVLAAAGCAKDDGPFFAPQVQLAYTRFINAVPDTGSVDFRFIDFLEYSPYAIQLSFRGFTPYQGTAPGSRPLRVFTDPGGSPSLQDVTGILADDLITLEAGKYYTIALVGYSRTGQTPAAVLQVFEDPIPDAGSSVAIRVVNLGTGLGTVNVGVTAASTDPIPQTPTFSNVAYLGQSQYQTRATGTYWFRVQDATAAEIVTGSGRQAPTGAIGDPLNNLTTIGGSQQAGSVVTAFLFPKSVPLSTAPSVGAPSLVFVVDKHPR